MIAAMESGSGKTVFTCGLLRALCRRGFTAEGFKCGPDYIDPMFHRQVMGVPSRNLDLFLQGADGVCRTLAKQTSDVAVLEGAMGFYDGVSGKTTASAWEVADVTDTPVVLVLRPKGSSITLAAQVRGLQTFRENSHITALVLTDCKPMLFAHLKPILEGETGLPVLGYLPPMEEAKLESRHLGLVTAGEIADLNGRFDAIAEAMEYTVDVDRLLTLCAQRDRQKNPENIPIPRCTIAVARDEAFCFYYEDSLDALRSAGAELISFSPLQDRELPPCDGLYLGGGYPELYARKLSENTSMREAVRETISGGLPTVAECGGFLYLQRTLEDTNGNHYPMAGVLSGEGFRTNRLQRFGYAHLHAPADSLLFRAGERVPVHEFHYWDCTENGTDLRAEKPNGRGWSCGVATETIYAAFPHLHFGGELPLAQRFTEAAAQRRKNHEAE